MLDPHVVDEGDMLPPDVSANQFDPGYIDVAERQPGVCALCRSHKGPFIDTRVDTPWGRIYVCVTTCGSQIADMCSSQIVAGRDQEIADLRDRVGSLLQELADAEATRVVPLADVNEVWRRRLERERASRMVEPEHVDPARCSATRKDGHPCTAQPLSGRDVCLAHSKQSVAA